MRNGYRALVLLICTSLAMFSCKQLNMQDSADVSTVIRPVHQKPGKAKIKAEKPASADRKENCDCFISVPQQVINASVLPGVEYKQVDLMGYEKLDLPTGDRLLIINWGCESYNLSFRFETSRFGTDTSKIKQWYSILTQLLYEVEPAINSPVKIQQGIDKIQLYLKQDSIPVAFNVPLTLSRDSVFSDIVFEQVKVLGDTAVRLDATFTLSEI
jgi:hypothetical protein